MPEEGEDFFPNQPVDDWVYKREVVLYRIAQNTRFLKLNEASIKSLHDYVDERFKLSSERDDALSEKVNNLQQDFNYQKGKIIGIVIAVSSILTMALNYFAAKF